MSSDDHPAQPRCIELEENLSHAAARRLAACFIEARGAETVVDASKVLHLGAQCAQILVSAVRSWQTDQVHLGIRGASQPFLDCARLLGVSSHLEPYVGH